SQALPLPLKQARLRGTEAGSGVEGGPQGHGSVERLHGRRRQVVEDHAAIQHSGRGVAAEALPPPAPVDTEPPEPRRIRGWGRAYLSKLRLDQAAVQGLRLHDHHGVPAVQVYILRRLGAWS